MRRAVFLDRDGVIVQDTGPITDGNNAVLMPGVTQALAMLNRAGYLLLVVTNQTVLARGLLDEQGMWKVERQLERRLYSEGAPVLDGFYYCGHHPNATVEQWRVDCRCRKPAPGLLLKASGEHDVDLSKSYMVGDRPSDITAGKRAGCRTVMIRTGRHLDPPIETANGFEVAAADMICEDLLRAAEKILRQGRS